MTMRYYFDIDSFRKRCLIKGVDELGYIDDVKFAQWWVEQRNAFRPKGIALLARELYQKGVSRAVIEDVLSQSSTDDAEGARLVAQKKIKALKHLPKLEQRKKLYGFLGRRGFSSEVINRVVDDMLSGGV